MVYSSLTMNDAVNTKPTSPKVYAGKALVFKRIARAVKRAEARKKAKNTVQALTTARLQFLLKLKRDRRAAG